MKKLTVILSELAFLFLMVLMIFLLLPSENVNDVSLSLIENDFLQAEGAAEMEKFGAMRLKRNFSLVETDYPEVIYYSKQDSMAVELFLVIKADESQLPVIKEAMDKHYAAQINAFDGYGFSQMELLNKAIFYENGPYIALIISDHPEEWLKVITDRTEGQS